MNRIMTLFAALVLSCTLAAPVFAQGGYEVKGIVVDQAGPVIGATVLEKGTTNGVSTGLDGDFILKVSSADAIVEVSCIGYSTQTFTASQIPAKILISEDALFLDDVVVIGYGTVKVQSHLRAPCSWARYPDSSSLLPTDSLVHLPPSVSAEPLPSQLPMTLSSSSTVCLSRKTEEQEWETLSQP